MKLPLSKKINNTKNPIDLYCDTVPLRILFCQQNICDNTQGPCLFGKVYMVNYAFPIRNWYNTFVVFPIKSAGKVFNNVVLLSSWGLQPPGWSNILPPCMYLFYLNPQAKLQKTWSEVRTEDPNRSMLEWLSTFYDVILSTWHTEVPSMWTNDTGSWNTV